MKYYDYKESKFNLFIFWFQVFVGVLIQILLGGLAILFGLLILAIIFDNKWLFEFYNLSNEPIKLENETKYLYTIILISISLSFIFYAGLVWIIKKVDFYKTKYYLIKEQLYEINTGLIFFLGFFPIFVNFIVVHPENNEYLTGITDTYFTFLTCLFSPYIYSIISKVHHQNKENDFKVSLSEYSKERFKK